MWKHTVIRKSKVLLKKLGNIQYWSPGFTNKLYRLRFYGVGKLIRVTNQGNVAPHIEIEPQKCIKNKKSVVYLSFI